MEDRYNKNFYIVMEYLRPFVSHNYIISSKHQKQLFENGKQGTLEKKKITNELGVYGVLVKLEFNQFVVYILLNDFKKWRRNCHE